MSLKTVMIIVGIKTAKTIEQLTNIQKQIFESDLELLPRIECNILINQRMKEIGGAIFK